LYIDGLVKENAPSKGVITASLVIAAAAPATAMGEKDA
jgi:hypothetical protein